MSLIFFFFFFFLQFIGVTQKNARFFQKVERGKKRGREEQWCFENNTPNPHLPKVKVSKKIQNINRSSNFFFLSFFLFFPCFYSPIFIFLDTPVLVVHQQKAKETKERRQRKRKELLFGCLFLILDRLKRKWMLGIFDFRLVCKICMF